MATQANVVSDFRNSVESFLVAYHKMSDKALEIAHLGGSAFLDDVNASHGDLSNQDVYDALGSVAAVDSLLTTSNHIDNFAKMLR